MLPAGAGALFSFFARLHTGLSYTTGREKANGILDISRFFHIWTALRQGRGPSVIGRRSRWDRCRVGPAAWVPARSRAGARWGTGYPSGGRGCFVTSGRSAPGGPPTPAGSPRWGRGPLLSVGGPFWTGAGWALPRGFPPGPGRGSRLSLRESPDAKSRGGGPPAPPWFMARSFPLARFGVVGRIVPVYGLLRCPCTCPDLGRFFG